MADNVNTLLEYFFHNVEGRFFVVEGRFSAREGRFSICESVN